MRPIVITCRRFRGESAKVTTFLYPAARPEDSRLGPSILKSRSLWLLSGFSVRTLTARATGGSVTTTSATTTMAGVAMVMPPVNGLVCPSDWDKRQTPFVSSSLECTYEGRMKAQRRGQDSLNACLLLDPVCSNRLPCNALRRCIICHHLTGSTHVGKRWRYKNATNRL